MESTTRLGQEDWRKKLERPDTEVCQSYRTISEMIY